ncbi:hypothetical protein ACMA1I_16165 [Pontibacter sp. 13R65]|uniref:hypothetical protein n=1 Tax=Pontibacter sp. 13R65 TaxID=3127458 RepID=UPI00301BAA0D
MKYEFYTFFVAALLLVTAQGCSILNQKYIDSKFYLTNHSTEKFDSIKYEIRINDELRIETPYKNQYLSHHYMDFILQVPQNGFNLNISIVGDGFEVEKDTTLSIPNGSDVAITFDFKPNSEKYSNPEIYEHLKSGTSDFRGFVDSLYANNIIDKDKTFLSDTIPSSNNINIIVFNEKKERRLVKKAIRNQK